MKSTSYPATEAVYQNANYSTCSAWWIQANEKTMRSSYQFQIVQLSLHGSSTIFILALSAILTLLLVVVAYIWMKRRKTYQKLVDCGFPTVFWRPKFVNYVYPVDASNAKGSHAKHSQLPSTSITGILPRMRRLDGPYGMYGTVYGVSTSVVHIAHPVPAVTILSAIPKIPDPSSQQRNDTRSTSKSCSCAATKEPAYDHFKNFCGEGVFTADGEDWKIKRAAVMHALLRGVGEPGGYQSKIEQQSNAAANQLIKELETYTRKTKSCEDQTVDIVPILQRATIGLIYRYITHTDLVMGPDKKDDFDIKKSSTSSSSTEVPETLVTANHKNLDFISNYLKSITRIRMIILAQSRSIWFLLPRWIYRVFSDMYQQEEATMIPIRNLAQLACLSAREQPTSPLALLYRNSSIYKLTDCNENGFSKNLINEAITLLFAGQDTSAATLSWTLHLLSLYPDVQNKLAQEVCSVFATEGMDIDSAYASKKLISKMPYLDAVIKESMRLYPVAPFIVRKLPTDIKIVNPHHGRNIATVTKAYTTLPAGSFACIWIYSLHRNPEFWNNPDDYFPERWLVGSQTDAGVTTVGAYMPFAFGPRNCVGQPLAQTILRSILSRLIFNFRFQDPRLNGSGTCDPKTLQKDMQAGFTVLPQDGVHLTIHDRQKK